jgi:Ca2+-transporting ATPase
VTGQVEPWARTVAELAADLGSGELGLDPVEADRRLAEQGPNELPRERPRPAWLLLRDELTHFMAVLLWIAGGLAFASRAPELGWAIWGVVCVNAAFSFWQHRKAERALTALQERLPDRARVYRGRRLEVVPVSALVAGDVVELSEGDRVPADARLIAADALRLDLSLLTGESTPVERTSTGPEPGRRAVDAVGVVLAGATVLTGRARALVYATGGATELGRVAALTAGVRRQPSTLSEQVRTVVRVITALATAMGVLVFVLGGVLGGLPTHERLLFAVAIVVANVPEGLLPTITLALALGVQRMARRRVLVRRMNAIETLSAVTVICTDKTGTLTRNEMSVREVWLPFAGASPVAEGTAPAVQRVLAAAALCTEAGATPGAAIAGAAVRDGMELALVDGARRAGVALDALRAEATVLRELPFDRAVRMMTVLVRWDARGLWPGKVVAISKGAPADVLQRCDRAVRAGAIVPLDDGARAQAVAAQDALASRGYRLLAVAAAEDGGAERGGRPSASAPTGGAGRLALLGLVAIMDPPREGVATAIETCRRAGIAVTMVTGDHGATALAIAREVGLARGAATVVTGDRLATMPDEELRALLAGGRELVFARVLPEQKLRLVEAYRALGHVVAVTGDGVNDAPALRAADVGVAMGASGTDVARAAADIVLLDDDFRSIVAAVEEGRSLFHNIRKFLTYILTSNVPEIAPYLAMLVLRIPPALGILQILAVDLGTDMLPALALGGEPPEPGIMDAPPRPRRAPLLDRALLSRAYLRLGVVQALASMGGFFLALRAHGILLPDLQRLAGAILAGTADAATSLAFREASTVALAAIVASQVGNVLACRSERLPALRRAAPNRLLAAGVAAELGLLVAIVHVPWAQRVFRTAPIPPVAWAALAAAPSTLVLLDDAWKRLARWRRSRAAAGSALAGHA